MDSTFAITEAKQRALKAQMEKLQVDEADLDEKFIKGSGSGGQKVNKTSSCVYLVHRPSGIEIKCQRARSQAMNRYYARRELCDQLEEKVQGDKSKRLQAMEKVRRQKRRRSRRQKANMLAGKRRQGEKKARRRPVRGEE